MKGVIASARKKGRSGTFQGAGFGMEPTNSKEDSMTFSRKNGWIVMSLLAVFFLAACGGGGGDSAAPPTPVVANLAATGITNVGATLNGTVNPNGLATEAWFEWGTSPTLVAPDNTTKQNFAAGTTVQAVTAPLTGLTFGTTYYFRLVASNSSGETKGTPILNFATEATRPTVTTLAADNTTSTSATLHGQVNPNFLPTAAWFEYGSSPTLAGATISPEVAIGSGSAPVATSLLITGQPFGGTVYFRAAARNDAGELKGDIDEVSLLNPPPVANAGLDNTVEMGQTVTLDGSGSTTPSGTITSYLWEQVAGTPVTLSDNTATKPTFTAPTVPVIGAVLRFQLTITDSRSLTASDNVDITVNWVGFADDFSSDSTGAYVVTTTLGAGGTLSYDAMGKRAQVDVGDNNGMKFSHDLPASDNGVFSLDFSPTTAYPSHGGIWVRLVQDANNYYEIKNFDYAPFGGTPTAPDIAAVKKFVGGVMVDNVAFPTAYTQGTTYNLKITFRPTQVLLEGFGDAVTLNTTDTTAISVTGFEIESGQQDAFYDNFKLLATP